MYSLWVKSSVGIWMVWLICWVFCNGLWLLVSLIGFDRTLWIASANSVNLLTFLLHLPLKKYWRKIQMQIKWFTIWAFDSLLIAALCYEWRLLGYHTIDFNVLIDGLVLVLLFIVHYLRVIYLIKRQICWSNRTLVEVRTIIASI